MLSEQPTRITPTFSGSVGTSSTANKYRLPEEVLQPVIKPTIQAPLEILTIESKTYEIYDRSSWMFYAVVAVERHPHCTYDVAFTLIGKDDPTLKNTEVSKGHPDSLEGILKSFLEQVMKK